MLVYNLFGYCFLMVDNYEVNILAFLFLQINNCNIRKHKDCSQFLSSNAAVNNTVAFILHHCHMLFAWHQHDYHIMYNIMYSMVITLLTYQFDMTTS